MIGSKWYYVCVEGGLLVKVMFGYVCVDCVGQQVVFTEGRVDIYYYMDM